MLNLLIINLKQLTKLHNFKGMERPVPLVTVSKDGKFQVEKEALESLKKIKGRVGK